MTTRRTIQVITEFRVARPCHDVYEFLVDTAHFRKVDQALVDFEPDGRMTVGMHGTMRHRRAGLTVRTRWHVTDLVSDERLLVEIRGVGYAMSEEVRLQEVDGETSMRVVDIVTGTSTLGDLFVLVSRRSIRRDIDNRADRLKSVLSAPSGPVAVSGPSSS